MPTAEERRSMIERIRTLPDRLEAALYDLKPEQLTTAYMPDEWTVAQNVHHLADAHMATFIRFKLILLEDRPLIKTYDQNDWAKSADSTNAVIEDSLAILAGLHRRWAALMDTLDEDDWLRIGQHPEAGEISLDDLLRMYWGHGDGHIDQINRTLAAGGQRGA